MFCVKLCYMLPDEFIHEDSKVVSHCIVLHSSLHIHIRSRISSANSLRRDENAFGEVRKEWNVDTALELSCPAFQLVSVVGHCLVIVCHCSATFHEPTLTYHTITRTHTHTQTHTHTHVIHRNKYLLLFSAEIHWAATARAAALSELCHGFEYRLSQLKTWRL